MPHSTAILLLAAALCAGCRGNGSRPAATPAPEVPRTPPNAPSGLTATPSVEGIDLTWQSGSTDETAFVIERSANGARFAMRGVTPRETVRWTDTQPEGSTLYRYRVRARNDHGASPPSNIVEIRTADASQRGCGLVLGGGFDPGAATESPRSHSLWMWAAPTGAERIVAAAETAHTGPTLTLDGGAAGTAWVTLAERRAGDILTIELDLAFSILTAAEHGARSEFCFSLHSSALGSYPVAGRSTATRIPVHARLPTGAALPIEPERAYRVRVRIDTANGVYDLDVDGLPLGSDIPLEGVFVAPVRYIHPVR